MNPRILVIGSANTDMVIKAERLPSPGESIIGERFEIFAGGKGANQAVAASRAGGSVTFLGAVGQDAFGEQTAANLARDAIDTSLLKAVPGVASGVALIIVGKEGENLIAVAPGANLHLTPQDLERVDFSRYGTILLQLEIPLDTVEAAIVRAQAAGCRVILNPAPSVRVPEGLLNGIDILVPNRGELALLSGQPVETEADLLSAARGLHQHQGVRWVIVTLGAMGALWFDGAATHRQAGLRVAAVDTVGAGDCFIGALAAALGQGRAMPEALSFASAAAALSVQKPGAQPSFPTEPEILRMAHQD